MSPISFLRGHPRHDLTAFADEQLPPKRHAEVEKHVATCAACAADVEEQRTVRAALRSLPQVTAPRSFALTPQMAAQPGRTVRGPAPQLVFGMRIATAGVAVALAVLVLVDLDGPSSNDSGGDDPAAISLQSAAGDSNYSQPGAIAVPPNGDDSVAEDAGDGSDRAATGAPVPADGDLVATPQNLPVTGETEPALGAGGSAGGPASGGGAAGVGTDVTPTPLPAAGGVDTEAPDAALVPEATPELLQSTVDTNKGLETDAAVADSDESVRSAPEADGGSDDADNATSGGDSDTLLVVEIALAVALVIALGATIYVSRRAGG